MADPLKLESILTELSVTLKHIDTRLIKVESDLGKNKDHDWKLYAYIAFGIVGSITWAWTQLSTSQNSAFAGVNATISRIEGSIKDSNSQRLVPIEMSLTYLQSGADKRNEMIEKLSDRVKQLEEMNARADERNQLLKSWP